MKYIVITFIIVTLLWFVPVKIVINSEEKINDFVESGEVVLSCSYQQIIGPLWKVERSYGTENCPANIHLVG